MVSIEDEDDHKRHNVSKSAKNATLRKLSAENGESAKPRIRKSSRSSSNNKRNVTYLHFLRKTRRKSNKHSFKATSPTTNARKWQALSAYLQKLLVAHKRSYSVAASSFHHAKSLENLHLSESSAAKCISNMSIWNNHLSLEDAKDSDEMKRVYGMARSKSASSLSSKSSSTSQPQSSCSGEIDSPVKAEGKHSGNQSGKNCYNAGHKRCRIDWPDKNHNYIIISNNHEPNGSYIRRPQLTERLCTRKKRRLRRRRKRKDTHRAENLIHCLDVASEQQLVNTSSSIVSTLNAQQESQQTSTDSQAQPTTIATATAPTPASTNHNMLESMSATAELLSLAKITAAQKYMSPASETLPKLSNSLKHRNKSCCSSNATTVQQQAKRGNKGATIKATPSASSAALAATPAIRLPAFYAATTLRLFLTALTTLIASTTPTTFTATKYSWIFLWIYVNLTARVGLAGYHEKRLLHDLLDPYNTLERPVLNESDPLQLSFGLTLMQIIDVDEKNQLLVTNVWLKLEWNDMNLRWNTSDYGGVKDLRIPPHRIWKPDVLMYNSADEGFDGTYQTNVVVRNNGSCLYVPPGIFKSTCKIDITWFPFDDQRCEMKFGSWTYDGFQLDLQLQDETGGDISSYVLNGEWELLGVPGKRNEIYYNCCPEPYIDITFAIIIRRRTLYYFFNLIIPCVLIASMALLGFTLPPDSGEKLSLGVTILLSLTVFLNMVAETMPATSDAVPLLGTYFNCIMFMVASSVVSTILILNYHHRNADTHEMSEWIRIVFLCWLPWILRMSRPGRPLILEFPTTPCSDTSSERKHQILSDVELKERSSKSLLANVLDIDDDFRHNCRPMTPGGTLPHNPAFYRTVYGQGDDGSIGPIGSTRMPDAVTHHTCIKSATEYELGLILKEIRFITDQLRKEDEENDIANDWKFAAMVVDRLCLIIFTMFTILATIAVLLSAPHIIVS
ncbi:neuronal acetylcholine receptor subunit alpha-7 [Bactrocera neohumeralis]|uniref:neuronal acetylcholine receptor subunit alpha-7 n=1 Tax=Bactrocera neohumeralis TaxID=98809 RepID=UPI002166568F|nr:neuronal acetylcholine receptor subunit alpha-7 [Bactrocera neohumeralis]XP_050319287.1 neuronal acetylcholine receptor subunit alpha-7 [Bactrocera neohumeralis]